MTKTTPEQVEQILELRRANVTRKAIAAQMGMPLSRIKDILLRHGVVIDPEIAQQNAYQSKLAKNPNAMQEMRKNIDFVYRAERVREAYRNNQELVELKRKQTIGWWNGQSPDYRKDYLARRHTAFLSSEKNKKYLNRGCFEGMTQEQSFVHRVEAKGGKVLGQFVNSKTKVLILCDKGHEFSTIPNVISMGNWCPKCINHISKPQIEIFEYVKSLVGADVEVRLSCRKTICPKELDIYIPSMNLAIEFHGLYWHSTAMERYYEQENYDKWNMCQEKGIQLLTFFQDDWYSTTKHITQSIIKMRLGLGNVLDIACEDVFVLDEEQVETFSRANCLDPVPLTPVMLGFFSPEGQVVGVANITETEDTAWVELRTAIGHNITNWLPLLWERVTSKSVVVTSDNRFYTGKSFSDLGFIDITPKTPVISSFSTDFSRRFPFEEDDEGGVIHDCGKRFWLLTRE